jgi:hypothetical protein
MGRVHHGFASDSSSSFSKIAVPQLVTPRKLPKSSFINEIADLVGGLSFKLNIAAPAF